MKTHIQNLFVVLAILAAIHKAAAQYARFSGNWSPRQVSANTHDGLTTNAGIHAGTLDVSGVVANLTFSRWLRVMARAAGKGSRLTPIVIALPLPRRKVA